MDRRVVPLVDTDVDHSPPHLPGVVYVAVQEPSAIVDGAMLEILFLEFAAPEIGKCSTFTTSPSKSSVARICRP